MKRIQSACICQTLHFMLKEDIPHDDALAMVEHEVRRYKASLEKKRIRHRILEERTEADGSVVIRIVKQYNQSPIGSYLD
ncbi:MAG: hypothetical protein J6K32_08155 [Clostridia bacterium]|nr:hypothetical protein [Clostridia bacterium]